MIWFFFCVYTKSRRKNASILNFVGSFRLDIDGTHRKRLKLKISKYLKYLTKNKIKENREFVYETSF